MLRIPLSLPKLFKGPLARATFGTGFVLMLRLLAQAAFLLIVTRLLDASLFGVFSGVAALAVLLGSISSAGTHTVLFSEMSIDPNRRNSILSWALPLAFSFGLLVFCAYLVLAIPLLEQTELSYDIALLVGMAEILIQPLIWWVVTEKHASGEIMRSQMLLLQPLFFKLLVVIILSIVEVKDALHIFAWGYLAASFFSLPIVIRQRTEKWPPWHTWRLPMWREFKHTLGYACQQFAAFGTLEADKTLALQLTSPHIAGIYAAATRIINALILPITSMMVAALPRLFRQYGIAFQGDRKLLRWIFFITLIYGILASLLITLAAPWLEKLFGGSFTGLTEVLRLLCFVTPALCLQIAAGSIFMSQNKPWHRATLEFFGLIVLVVAAITPDFLDPSSRMPFALGCAQWTLAVVGWCIVYQKQRKAKP